MSVCEQLGIWQKTNLNFVNTAAGERISTQSKIIRSECIAID